MRFIWAVGLAIIISQSTYAGDDASGPIPFRVDLSQHFTTYSMSVQDKLWSASLSARLMYKGHPFISFRHRCF